MYMQLHQLPVLLDYTLLSRKKMICTFHNLAVTAIIQAATLIYWFK